MLTDISCWWSMVVPTFSMILPVAGRLERGWSTVLSSGSFQKGLHFSRSLGAVLL